MNFQLIGSLIALFLFTLVFDQLDTFQKSIGVAFVIITLINCGALLEQHKWIYPIEVIRMQIICAAIAYIIESPASFILGLIIIQIIADLTSVKRKYYEFLFQEVTH